MSLILAIQPDEQQAAILSGVVMNQLRADLVLVDSKDAALARIRKRVPDLILLAAELGRPDDEEFASRLRKIKDAEHLRTLSMPTLGSAEDDEQAAGGGLLRAFTRKRAEGRRRGRDPKQFARELRACLTRAERLRAERRSDIGAAPVATAPAEPAPAPPTDPVAAMPAPPADPVAATPGPPDAPAVATPPVVTLDAIEMRVIRSMRAVDTADAGPHGDADAIIRALRVPPRVAGFSYPSGCRISQIRLAKAPRSRLIRRPAAEPPPCGDATRLEASF